MMDAIRFIMNNFQAIVNGIVGVLLALIALFMLFPGNEPENTLQKIVDFIKRFSLK